MLHALRMMTKLLAALALAISVPAVALADAPKAAMPSPSQDGRVVLALKDGKTQGYKLYAIREGGIFDRPGARFQNGDTIVKVNGKGMDDEHGYALFLTKVWSGEGDAVVTLIRKGTEMEMAIKGK